MAAVVPTVILLLLATCCFASSTDPTQKQWCTYGCDQAVDYNVFAGSPNATDGYYLAGCRNELQVSSFWACARRYCDRTEFDAGYQWKSVYCLTYGGIDVLPPSIIADLTKEDIKNLPILDFGSADTVNTTSLPSQETYSMAYRTGAEYYTQVMHHVAYTQAMFIFWGIVVGIGISYNFLYHYGPTVHSRLFIDWWVKAKAILITLPHTALQGDNSCQPLLETLVNAAFLIINIILCAVNYTAFEGNIFWPSTSLQTWRYIADRTGYLAYANLSIFWLFGIRNDVLIWLTGWPFATFSRFHRTVAFISTIEAIVHSIAYSVFSYVEGGNAEYLESFSEQYWNVGVVATITMSLSVVLSVTWFRVRWYAIFLVAHIVFALITLVMLFYHTAIFLGEFDGYLWPCVGFWALDRLMRLLRIVWNVVTAKSVGCLIEYDNDSDVVRVNVTDALSCKGRDSDDAYYYMYMLRTFRCWESHPFTLVRWKETEESGWLYSFLIRPYDGFTRTLAKHALSMPVIRTCFFEGPYGFTPEICRQNKRFSGVTDFVYIIGGSGISVAISSIYSILEHSEGCIPNIKLIWAIRKRAFLTDILDRELRCAKERTSIVAHVTQGIETILESKIPESKASDGSGNSSSTASNGLSIHHARPDIRQYVLDAAGASQGVVTVVTCGPVKMMGEVKRAAVEANRGGVERVRVHAEDFSW